MLVTIKLMPPYRKAGEPGEFSLTLPEGIGSLNELAEYLSREQPENLAFDLLDHRGLLTAEFLVNGKHVPVEYAPVDGDLITVIPYICGG